MNPIGVAVHIRADNPSKRSASQQARCCYTSSVGSKGGLRTSAAGNRVMARYMSAVQPAADTHRTRAAPTALGSTSGRELRAASGAQSHVVHRYVDLYDTYQEPVLGLDSEEKRSWLDKFTHIQELLNNSGKVKQHLEGLAAYMGKKGVSLNQALRDHEAGLWTDAQPILTDFVPSEVFEDFVQRGQIFVDLVAERHGIQTHRIQWYLVKSEFGEAFVKETYPESVNPRWKRGKNMWDRVVDETEVSDDSDFTMPEKLETFLVTQFEKLCSRSDIGKLHGEIAQGHDAHRETKTGMQNLYPPEKKYTAKLKTAMERHKSLIAAKNDLDANYAELPDKKTPYKENENQRQEVLASIVNERVTHRSGGGFRLLGGRRLAEVYTWTGWILGTSGQSKNASTYFIPTVAYPEGADPDQKAMDSD